MNNPRKIEKIESKTIAHDLVGVSPMTLEDCANGRTIKPYPYKYDDFNTIDDLKEYIVRGSHLLSLNPARWDEAKVIEAIKDIRQNG